jgi:hypothetical protein
MHERFYERGTLPRLIPPGRVLGHNRVPHTINEPSGLKFRCWSWLKDDVPPNFKNCDCGWSGLPHVAEPN